MGMIQIAPPGKKKKKIEAIFIQKVIDCKKKVKN